MIAVNPFSISHIHATLHRTLFVAVLGFAAFGATRAGGASPDTAPPLPDALGLVQAVLPAGWTVQQVSTGVLPAGWQSLNAAATNVQVGIGGRTVTLALVPNDWVGLQLRETTVAPVRRGPRFKVIVSAGSADELAWLDKLAPHQASLASADGTTTPYAGQYRRVAAEVRLLLRKSGASREQAIASFIALGVPAETYIRDTALDSRSPARLVAIRALRHFPGKATREALSRIIADRSRDAAADTSRLAAFETCAALQINEHGPAVLAALQVEKDEVMAARLADEINRLRHSAAAPELRRWLKTAKSLDTKVACARALATIRDSGAATEIQAALSAPAPRRASVAPSADGAARRQLAFELHRLTGAWGPDQRGTRLSLAVESPDRVLVHVENLGEGPLRFIPFAAAPGQPWPVGLEIFLDGRSISPPGPRDADIGRTADIAQTIAPGTAMCFELQLTSPLLGEGNHALSATWFDLRSNALAISSGVVSDRQEPPAS